MRIPVVYFMLIVIIYMSIISLSQTSNENENPNNPDTSSQPSSIINDENLQIAKLFKFFTSEEDENKKLISEPPKQTTLGFVTPWARKGYELAVNSTKLTYVSPVWFRITYENDDVKLVADADIDETWIDKILQKSNPQKTSNSIQDAEKPFQSLEESQDLIIHHNTMIVPRVQLDVASFPREKLIKFFTDIQETTFTGAQRCIELIENLLEKYPKFSGIVLEYGYLSLDKKTPLRSFFHALFSNLNKRLHEMNKKFLVVVPAPHFPVSLFEKQPDVIKFLMSSGGNEIELQQKIKEWENAIFKEMEQNFLFSRSSFMELQAHVDHYVMMNYDYGLELINADIENYKAGNFKVDSEKDKRTINWLLENSDMMQVSPMKWIEKTIKYFKSESKNDMKKLLIGINFYGKEIITTNNLSKKTSEAQIRAVTGEDLKNVIIEAQCLKRNYKPEKICSPFKAKNQNTEKKLVKFLSKFHPLTREQVFIFSYIYTSTNRDTIKEIHEIAFPSWRNVKEKLDLTKSLGISGVSIWELGQSLDKMLDLF